MSRRPRRRELLHSLFVALLPNSYRVKMVDEPEIKPTVGWFRAFLAISCVAPVSFSVGAVLSQSAEMIPQLLDPKSPIHITREDATWIASASTAGTLISCCICGFLADMFGRLRTVQLCLFFHATGYGIIAASSSFTMIMIGRLLLGVGVGFCFTCMVYAREVSPPQYRSVFLSLFPLICSIGLTFNYIIGALLPWNIASGIMCLIGVVGFSSTFFSYDTPQWLVGKGRMEEALKSIQRVEHPVNVESRLKELQEAAAESQKQENSKLGIGGWFFEPIIYRPFLMICALTIMENLSGFYILIHYTVNFMNEFHTAVNPHQVTIALGMTRIVSTGIASCLFHRIGRKTAGVISGSGAAIGLFIIFVFLKLEPSYPILHEQYSWIPAFGFMVYMLSSGIGIYPLPLTFPSEVFPFKVRGAMGGICFAAVHIIMFITIKMYNVILDGLGIQGTVLMFAISATLFAIFAGTIMVETHKKTFEEIQQYFRSGRKPSEEMKLYNTFKTDA